MNCNKQLAEELWRTAAEEVLMTGDARFAVFFEQHNNEAKPVAEMDDLVMRVAEYGGKMEVRAALVDLVRRYKPSSYYLVSSAWMKTGNVREEVLVVTAFKRNCKPVVCLGKYYRRDGKDDGEVVKFENPEFHTINESIFDVWMEVKDGKSGGEAGSDALSEVHDRAGKGVGED